MRCPSVTPRIEVGGYVGLSKTGVITSQYDKLTATVSSRWDVSGKNKSYVVTPSITYLTPLSLKAAVGLLASGTYVGTGYARYYYGVSAADSRASGLPIYNPSHNWNSYTVGGFGTYSLTGNLLHGVQGHCRRHLLARAEPDGALAADLDRGVAQPVHRRGGACLYLLKGSGAPPWSRFPAHR